MLQLLLFLAHCWGSDMAFNLGAFAGGLASGMSEAEKNAQRQAETALRRQQLNTERAQQMGMQAYYNTMIPGGQPIDAQPQRSPLAQLPVDIFNNTLGPQGLGLFGAPAMPQQPQQGMPQQGATMPQGAPRMAQAPSLEGMTPQQIAGAIDAANPGLRQRNPMAYARAVQMAIETGQAGQMRKAELGKTSAQEEELRARAEYDRQHAGWMKERGRVSGVATKPILEAFKQNEMNIRKIMDQRSRIATAWDINAAEKKQMLAGLDNELQGYSAQREILRRQLMGQESIEPTKLTPEQKAESTTLAFRPETMGAFKTAPYDRLKRVVDMFKQEGASKERLKALLMKMHEAGVSEDNIRKLIQDAGL